MKKYSKILPLLLMGAVLLASCEPEEQMSSFSFNSKAEALQDTKAEGSKVYLVNEKWLYWEDGDIISIGSDATGGGDHYMAQLANINAGYINGDDFQEFNGVFVCNLPVQSRYFFGLHPYSPRNTITPVSGTGGKDFNGVIDLPRIQPVATDWTFTKNVFPMVAWYGGEWDQQPWTPFNFDFHSLAGVVRIQMFNNFLTYDGPEDLEIDSIAITAVNTKISGLFSVYDYKTANPKLEVVEGSDKVTITCPTPRYFGYGDLLSFYLVLPSKDGSMSYDQYPLKMVIHCRFAGSNEPKKISGLTSTVRIRRSGITYTNAIEVKMMDESSGENNGQGVGLVGNGTYERPFKIYTVEDLNYVQRCFDTGGDVKVNGQLVTDQTWFHVMRNDIDLTYQNWSEGIKNFKGKFVLKSNTTKVAGVRGINNGSNSPLFESVSAQGEVIDVVLHGWNESNSYHYGDVFCPFVKTNKGTLTNCRVDKGYYNVNEVKSSAAGSKPTVRGSINSSNAALAGVCFYNEGLIQNCQCEASFTTQHEVGGVCFENKATGRIVNSVAATPMDVVLAKNVGGVCYYNYGTITDSYFTMRKVALDNFNWAGIAYHNHGTITHCYTSATSVLSTSASAAGIVGVNFGGTVDYCYFEGSIRAKHASGIIGKLESGTVINSYVAGGQLLPYSDAGRDTSYIGGLVDSLKGGTLTNCYYYAPRIYIANSGQGNKVGSLIAAGVAGTVNNSYAYETGAPINPVVGVLTSTTFTNCFVIGTGSTISGVTYKTSCDAAMLSSLNEHKGSGKSWVMNGSAIGLEPYVYPASKFGRR